MVSLACKRSDIGPQRANPGGSESQANLFASQLLMPDYLFRPMSARLPLTFESARPLRERFQTSLTATAIKMVRTGHYPGMVVCHEHGRLKWAMPGPDLPRSLQPVRELDSDSQAYDLWKVGSASDTRPQLTSAETWIDCESAEDYELVEHSILVADGVTVTLLWWKDESQVRDWQHRR